MMKPTLPTPDCTTENDQFWYSLACMLDRLDLTEHGDVNTIFKWLVGEE